MTTSVDRPKPIHLTAPAPIPGSTALYRFFSGDGVLLYIGKTVRPPVRWYTHSTTQRWWPEVSAAFVQWLPNERAEAAEREAIRSERPKYNQSAAEDRRPGRRAALDLPAPVPMGPVEATDMVSITQAARRLVDLGIVPSMSREGIRKISKTDPEWPIRESDMQMIGNAAVMPWAPIELFFRNRATLRKRGPDRQPRKRKADPPAE